MSVPVVALERVSKDFRPGLGLRQKRVLDGIDLEVQEGEIFGFVGPNGAGKTTTLKILMGLIHPTEGSARILGCDVRETEHRRHIGFLPEQAYFYEYLSGRELLRFYGRLCGLGTREADARGEVLLERVGLAHAADARLRTYSKGMCQRLGLAQALVNDPRVVFLDEPMSGLDPVGRSEIRDLIRELRDEGKTVFMNTHILPDVEFLCDRIALIVAGRIRFQGSVDRLLTGDAQRVDVLLTRVPVELAETLEERHGAPHAGHGERVALRVLEKEVPGLLRLALDAGAEVISVVPHRTSLEQAFLEALREET